MEEMECCLSSLSFCGGITESAGRSSLGWLGSPRNARNDPYRLMYRNFMRVITEVVRSWALLTNRVGTVK